MEIDGATIKEIMLGDMGIKEAYIGDTKIYERTGGYVYIDLQL